MMNSLHQQGSSNSIDPTSSSSSSSSSSSFGDLDVAFPGAADASFAALYSTLPPNPALDPKPHISSSKAAYAVNVKSLRKRNDDGTFSKYSLREAIPLWPLPLEDRVESLLVSWFASEFHSHSQASFLDVYGAGLALYFKLLKALAAIFALMSVLTLPSLILFGSSNAVPERELFYAVVLNSQVALAQSTMANLGEPIATCREVTDTELFSFTCPPGYLIQSPVGYYGQPTGSCACPYPNQVDSHTNCKGIQGLDAVGKQACIPGPDQIQPLPCFPDSTRFGNRCCALTPDGNDLNLAPTPGCNSLTAPFILAALCTDQPSCTLLSGLNNVRLSATANYSFPIANLLPYDGVGLKTKTICKYVEGDLCITTLGHNMETSGCQLNPYASPAGNTFSGGALGGSISSSTEPGSALQQYKLIFEAVCVMSEVTIGRQVVTDDYIVSVASALNFLAAISFILGLMWIKVNVNQSAEEGNTNTCTAGDYTIIMHTLPAEYNNEEELKALLTRYFDGICGNSGTGGGGGGSGSVVADITLVPDAPAYLQACVARGAAASGVDAAVGRIMSRRARHVWKDEDSGCKGLLSSLKSALLKFEAANDACLDLSPGTKPAYSRTPTKPITIGKAFVTFVSEEHTKKVVDRLGEGLQLGLGGGAGVVVGQDDDVLIDGKGVACERAPEPEEVIYENIVVHPAERLMRVIVSGFLMIIVLGVSYALIYEAQVSSELFAGNKDAAACATYSVLVSSDPAVYSQAHKNTITYYDVQRDFQPERYGLNHSSDSWGSYGYLDCYCSQVLLDARDAGSSNALAVMQAYTFYDRALESPQPWCLQNTQGSGSSASAKYLATFVIIVVNGCLASTLKSLVEFERHPTHTTEIISLVVKLYVTMYANTALLSLMISGSDRQARLFGGHPLNFFKWGSVSFGLFTGKIADYTVLWYSTVGCSMLFTMFLFTLGSQPALVIALALKTFSKAWDSRWTFRTATNSNSSSSGEGDKKNTASAEATLAQAVLVTRQDTQHDYEELQLGPEFDLKQKYASLLCLIFVDMTYSPTMPLFNLITLLNLALIYVSDKYMLIHFTSRPGVVDDRLAKKTVDLFFWAALINVSNGMWMWGCNSYYNPDISTFYSTYEGSPSTTKTSSSASFSPSRQPSTRPSPAPTAARTPLAPHVLSAQVHRSLSTPITAQPATLPYLSITHSWEGPVSFKQRLGGTYSRPLLVLFLLLSLFLAAKFIYSVVYLKLGLRQLIWHLVARANANADTDTDTNTKEKANAKTDKGAAAEGETNKHTHSIKQLLTHYFGRRTTELEGNPPFFEAIPTETIIARLHAGNLEPAMHKRYEQLRAERAANIDDDGGKVKNNSADANNDDNDYDAPMPQDKRAAKTDPSSIPSPNPSPQHRMLSNHESYNMRTLHSYDKKMGLTSRHLNRVFAAASDAPARDYILASKTCVRPALDDVWLDARILEFMPKRQRVPDPLKSSASRFIIPRKALLLDSLLGPLLGGSGAAAFNGIKGFECLAEPDEDGEQHGSSLCGGAGEGQGGLAKQEEGGQASTSSKAGCEVRGSVDRAGVRRSIVVSREDDLEAGESAPAERGGRGNPGGSKPPPPPPPARNSSASASASTATFIKGKPAPPSTPSPRSSLALARAQDQDDFGFGSVYEDKSEFSSRNPNSRRL